MKPLILFVILFSIALGSYLYVLPEPIKQDIKTVLRRWAAVIVISLFVGMFIMVMSMQGNLQLL